MTPSAGRKAAGTLSLTTSSTNHTPSATLIPRSLKE